MARTLKCQPVMFSQLSLVILAWLSHLNPAAEDLIAQLQRQAMSAQLQTIEARGGEGIAAVQIDLLPDHESAMVLAADMQLRLDELGAQLEVFVETISGDAALPPSFRVGVGPFDDFEQAERAQLTLERLGVNGFVRELEAVVGC